MVRPRLLVIDDEPHLGEFLAEVARCSGYSTQVTSNAAEFRRSFRAAHPEMVALDLGMPGTDGIELLRFLAGEGYRSTVLIVSGFERRVLDSAFRLGEALGLTMAGPIEKPMRASELEAIFTRLKSSLAA